MYPKFYGENPNYPNPHHFEVVQRPGNFGKGVISYRRFEPGDLLAEITGEVVTYMTQHTLQIEPGVHLLDLHFSGYFLHSCAPNVHLDMRNRLVYATKTIRESEFLEMDYAQTEEILFKQFACSCGAPNCRAWITGSAEEANVNDPDFQAFLGRKRIGA